MLDGLENVLCPPNLKLYRSQTQVSDQACKQVGFKTKLNNHIKKIIMTSELIENCNK